MQSQSISPKSYILLLEKMVETGQPNQEDYTESG